VSKEVLKYQNMDKEVGKENPVKYCPIMTSGNVAGNSYTPYQNKVVCMGKACGIWNEDTKACGLVSRS
jgi:hypothetical protein